MSSSSTADFNEDYDSNMCSRAKSTENIFEPLTFSRNDDVKELYAEASSISDKDQEILRQRCKEMESYLDTYVNPFVAQAIENIMHLNPNDKALYLSNYLREVGRQVEASDIKRARTKYQLILDESERQFNQVELKEKSPLKMAADED